MTRNGPLRSFGIRPLAARLLAYVLLFSLLLSLIASGVQMMGEFDRRESEITQLQERSADALSPSLVSSLSRSSERDVRANLEGLLAFPAIQSATLVTDDGKRFSVGTPVTGERVEQTFPVVGTQRDVAGAQTDSGISSVRGELTITSSLISARHDVFARGLLLFLFQSIIVMLGTLGLILIVRLTLTRHLETLADYIKRLNFDALIAPLKLKRRTPKRADELSEVEQALNTMRLQLLAEARDLQQSSIQSRDERDEAVRANNAKNLFLANVSHELRTPLQSVLGYSSLLSDTPLDSEQKDYVLTLQNAATNLSDIINDLLDISSMEAGKLVLKDIPFDLRDNLNDLVIMLGERAREKNLALELQVDENLPAALRGDPIRFRQVLLNLTANAIKFTDSGHVLISLDVIGRRQDAIRIRVAIEDTGVGIHPNDLPLIYEPYFQLKQQPGSQTKPYTHRQISGAGLGLTICRQLVNLMGGELDVQSQPGDGSTFWLELDLAIAPGGTTRVRPDARMIQGRRVLVVDSYALSRKITLEMLSRYDMEIEAVKSAAEAVEAMRQSAESKVPFDAVLLDGFMPDMDSDRLCEQIRRDSQWQAVRLLVLSSNPQRGDAEHFRRAGADGFLSKSLRDSCLPPMLHQMFSGRVSGVRHFVTRFSLQPEHNEGSARPLPCGRMSVLLVEDNPVNRKLTKRLLEKLGNDVTTANDGAASLELLRWHRFDLVFMDCIMPGVDGFDATRQLRQWERERSLANVPVIALTASAMEQDKQHCRDAGMDAFVAKPVSLDPLRDVLEQFCQSAPESV